MSTHDTPGTHSGPGQPSGISWRWLLRAAVVPAVLLLGGTVLILRGLSGPGRGPHPQPLPIQRFAIAPAAARELPRPPRLARPQPGSIQSFCARVPASEPQVSIPSLCIFAPLVPARVAGGALLIPPDVRLAGLDTSSAPLDAGQGTTIIAGHVDNFNQGDGVFYFLSQAQPGAPITVSVPGQAPTAWRVYQVSVADKSALPSDIWSLAGPRRLVLVTCGGPIEHTPAGNTYSDNVLIYATPATTSPPKPPARVHRNPSALRPPNPSARIPRNTAPPGRRRAVTTAGQPVG
jgi:hypothetical protein